MGASWQAFYAHLCAASIIRAMPETEIPPAMRGDLYYSKYFMFLCVLPPFSFPYNCKRKQAARTQAAKQAFATLRAER
jgi:hypothetical protein